MGFDIERLENANDLFLIDGRLDLGAALLLGLAVKEPAIVVESIVHMDALWASEVTRLFQGVAQGAENCCAVRAIGKSPSDDFSRPPIHLCRDPGANLLATEHTDQI